MEIQITPLDDSVNCCICHNPLTPYGSKALNGAMMCRNCAQFASVWLSDKDLAKMSSEDMLEHLSQRDGNEEQLKNFKPDTVVEGKYTLFIDTENQAFAISRDKDYMVGNPDLIPTSAIYEIAFMDEKYNGTDNVDVYFEIKVKGLKIKKLRFRVNAFPGMEKGSQQHYEARNLANQYVQALTVAGKFECNKLQLKRR